MIMNKETGAVYEPEAQMFASGPYEEVLNRFKHQQVITIATGATCAYLGDERNLREFLVAEEMARWLRRAGHTVLFFLIDDSLDPLNIRQLRIAVNKDEKLIERFKGWCGKPIAHLPDPWGCHESYASHFEEELLKRLHRLDCHPTLVTTAKLYERGVYAPYVRLVLERHDEIMEFLSTRFQGYRPQKLFWVLCPHCRYIHATEIRSVRHQSINVYCHHCEQEADVPIAEIQGKLNWKLDCAVRWAVFKVDVEPFNKSYMEPETGSVAVAQGLSEEFFGGHPVHPLHYGLVKMEKNLSYKLLESLPSEVLRPLLTERPAADIKLTRDLVITMASRHQVLPQLSYLEFIKQLLPMWLLTPHSLSPEERDLVAHGMAFREHFLDAEARPLLPSRTHFEREQPAVLGAVLSLLIQVLYLRRSNLSWEEFQEPVKEIVDTLGEHKKAALHRLRLIVGQKQGLPAARFLFVLPLDYLQLLEYMLELHLYLQQDLPDELPRPVLRAVA